MTRACLVFLALFFLIQFSFFPMLEWEMAVPNFILVVTVVIGTRKSALENLGWFLLAGFIFEIFSAEIFGFNLLVFSLTGIVVWFFKNIILNKERNLLLEVVFWFLVKIVGDFIYKIIFILFEIFQKQERTMKLFEFSDYYLRETFIFILSGILVTLTWSFLRVRLKSQFKK